METPESVVGVAGPGPVSSALAIEPRPTLGPGSGARTGSIAIERSALAVLAGVTGLGPVSLERLRNAVGSATGILELAGGDGGIPALVEASGATGGRPIGPDIATAIADAAADAAAALRRIDDLGLSVVSVDEPAYPDRLRAIELPPHVLFVRGSLSAVGSARAVAIVGTRRPTDGGRRIATRIANAVARSGAAVVSGLAIGIDGVAHDAAIEAGGATVAVLGSGHDRLVPRAHALLADRAVRSGGAVVSEFAPGTPPARSTFPRRNRIISGLAEATIVVEAAARSGALITADWALQQGRGCFLVPGSIEAPTSAGCLRFLRDAHGEARIVAGIPELVEDLELVALDQPPVPERGPNGASLAEVGRVEREIGHRLAAGMATVDELVAATGLETATVLGALTMLEVRGLAASAYGRYRPAGSLVTASREGSSGRRRAR